MSKIDFKWKGDEVECYNELLSNENHTFYQSFYLNGELYCVGEFVMDKDDDVCRLLCVYQTENDKKLALIQWYTWAAQFSHFAENNITIDVENELVEDHSKNDIEFNLFQIKRKCMVVFATISEPLYFTKQDRNSEKLYYFARYKYEDLKLLPIFLANDNETGSNNKSTPSTRRSTRIKHRDSIRRNLNDSFGDSLDANNLNYSIVEENELKLKLRVSSRKVQTPVVYLERLQETPTRKSSRQIKRVSYADFLTPLYGTPYRRGRSKSVQDDACSLKNTPKKTLKSTPIKETLSKKVEDDEVIIIEMESMPKKTPKTPKNRLKLIKEGVITPTMQSRKSAIISNSTPLMKARSQLHVSFLPKDLPCREKEYHDVFHFIKGKLLDRTGGCMYVSGVPGTGKTATVTSVINFLLKLSETDDVPKFEFLSINGMKLTEPRQAYVEIYRQMNGKTVTWEQAHCNLEQKFTKNKKANKSTIILIDELDIICTKRQDVVYNLLDWPSKATVPLIVITIANTMDLPERLLMSRISSRLGLTRITFHPYNHKQLQEIVTNRLSGIKTFNPEAIQFVARKVASVSGDARRTLDICRRAVEIGENEGENTIISMKHVNDALKEMLTQPKVQAIRHCSLLEQLILQAIVAETERTGVEETTFAYMLKMLISLAALNGFKMVAITMIWRAVMKLSTCRLLLTDQKSNNIYQKIILNVSSDDVFYALKSDL